MLHPLSHGNESTVEKLTGAGMVRITQVYPHSHYGVAYAHIGAELSQQLVQ
ncbi:hypothetical protein [Pantoea eucrina]|uniref:hypothetical protein n=1 Tax=Pantoea eucrina TaxID=472693 RepID=UPI001428C2D0|nr:hypothetical protein [Pantoea eucrina]